MPEFMIRSPHVDEDCLQARDQMVEEDPKLLEQVRFGCRGGDHTAFAIVEAEDALDALKKVPAYLRDKASVVEVDRITPEQLRSLDET